MRVASQEVGVKGRGGCEVAMWLRVVGFGALDRGGSTGTASCSDFLILTLWGSLRRGIACHKYIYVSVLCSDCRDSVKVSW